LKVPNDKYFDHFARVRSLKEFSSELDGKRVVIRINLKLNSNPRIAASRFKIFENIEKKKLQAIEDAKKSKKKKKSRKKGKGKKDVKVEDEKPDLSYFD